MTPTGVLCLMANLCLVPVQYAVEDPSISWMIVGVQAILLVGQIASSIRFYRG